MATIPHPVSGCGIVIDEAGRLTYNKKKAERMVEIMRLSKTKYRIACGALLGATLLAYIPLFVTTKPGMQIHNLIIYLLPMLFLERELLFAFAYFLVGERRGKVKTLTKGLRLLFARA